MIRIYHARTCQDMPGHARTRSARKSLDMLSTQDAPRCAKSFQGSETSIRRHVSLKWSRLSGLSSLYVARQRQIPRSSRSKLQSATRLVSLMAEASFLQGPKISPRSRGNCGIIGAPTLKTQLCFNAASFEVFGYGFLNSTGLNCSFEWIGRILKHPQL